MASIKTLGLIVNPIAGMGGKVALKGTDGERILAAARAKGAVAECGEKAERALRLLALYRESLLIRTASGPMGEDLCRKLNLPCEVVYRAGDPSSPADTIAAASAIRAKGAALLLFAGGDGTARNICEAVGENFPVLGIPAGVKIQSAVFALHPESAGAIAATIAQGLPVPMLSREVVDLDEDAYRTGSVRAALFGSMLVPNQPDALQCMKQGGFSSEEDQLRGAALYLRDHMDPDTFYAVGSGSTAKCISRLLGLEYELLGVDMIQGETLVEKDLTEERLWSYAQTGRLKIIVSPIGGQGFLFGRGNHQFSARVLHAVGKTNLLVVAGEAKLLSLPRHRLHVDCDKPEICRELRGYYQVLCGYGRFHSLLCQD